jgi:hypothetical protein
VLGEMENNDLKLCPRVLNRYIPDEQFADIKKEKAEVSTERAFLEAQKQYNVVMAKVSKMFRPTTKKSEFKLQPRVYSYVEVLPQAILYFSVHLGKQVPPLKLYLKKKERNANIQVYSSKTCQFPDIECHDSCHSGDAQKVTFGQGEYQFSSEVLHFGISTDRPTMLNVTYCVNQQTPMQETLDGKNAVSRKETLRKANTNERYAQGGELKQELLEQRKKKDKKFEMKCDLQKLISDKEALEKFQEELSKRFRR